MAAALLLTAACDSPVPTVTPVLVPATATSGLPATATAVATASPVVATATAGKSGLTLRGRVIDAVSRKPVENAAITVWRMDAGGSELRLGSLSSDSGGDFAFPTDLQVLPRSEPPNVHLYVVAPGYSSILVSLDMENARLPSMWEELALVAETTPATAGGTPTTPLTPGADCEPTRPGSTSATYRAPIPLRSSVGSGYILSGLVRSSRGCATIAGAQVELWPEVGGGHPDRLRARIVTTADGGYRYESPPFEHIHIRISAPGHYAVFAHYHPEGRAAGTLNFVLLTDDEYR